MRAALKAWIGSACVLALVCARPVAVCAEDTLVLMREPTAYTDVIDAADGEDRFDVNMVLGYQRELDRGNIQRETTTSGGGRKRAPLARSEHVVSQLELGVDLGLYKDLMAFMRVPLILRDTRELSLASGVSEAEASALLQDPYGASATAGSFGLPLRAPDRAGFDYLAFGGAVAVTSQQRKAWLPNWIFVVEGRRAISRLLRPCQEIDGGETLCRSPNGQADLPSVTSNKSSSGVSRGVSSISLETRLSKRLRYAEPYAGLGVLIEWASTAKQAFDVGGGFKQTAPPRQLSLTLGTELIPWEHRGRHQRVSVDARLAGTYYTTGLDYSALYDALGSADEAGARSGLTTVGAHMKAGGRLGAQVRAARYVRFALGGGVWAVSQHPLTGAAACGEANGDSCARYRPSIDAPGRRFWMTDELLWELYASATAQF
ncbi:MAG TPA: hypothetical protein VFZ61_03205 [Polyangiales bacterium]